MQMPGDKKTKHSKGYNALLNTVKIVIIALAVVLVVFVVIFLAQRAYNIGYEAANYSNASSDNEAEDVYFTVREGMTASDIGEALIKAELIDESLDAFLLQDQLSGLHDEYIPGTYALNPSMSVDDILEIICTPAEDEDDN